MTKKRQYVRQFFAYKDYYKDFKRTLTEEEHDKIYFVLLLIMTVQDIPITYFRNGRALKVCMR